MGRYVFKSKDLAPLREWLNNPVARGVLESAIPIKRFERKGQQSGEPIALPVPVQSREEPDGVPLPALLKAVKAEDPTVVGIVVRGDKMILKHRARPKAADREKVLKLVKDPKKLQALGRTPTPPKVPALRGEDLEKLLLSEETPDAEWLRAFRRYAVANLIKTRKAPK
ncbi:MAG: hypothetical protein JXB05_01050 [Myxococcaceae bacterium]|nr:hypothetical protein [Myxococcaceae bacterium]